MKTVREEIYEKLTLNFIEEEQKLNISIVNYVSPKSKIKSGKSIINKTYNSRYLLRILWKLIYLDPIQINRSTNNFIFLLQPLAWLRLQLR